MYVRIETSSSGVLTLRGAAFDPLVATADKQWGKAGEAVEVLRSPGRLGFVCTANKALSPTLSLADVVDMRGELVVY